jgi:cell division protein FtsB
MTASKVAGGGEGIGGDESNETIEAPILAKVAPFLALVSWCPPRVQLASALQRALPIGILSLALVGAPVLIFEPQGLPRMQTLEQELTRIEGENAELRRDIGALRVEVHDLRDNPAAVERIARNQLGLVRKSEIVFQFGKAR